MNIDQLREELAADEGVVYEIYLDHLALPTCGVGHLIRKEDEEYGQPVGTPISEERVRQLFALDVAVTIEDCRALFDNWDQLPEEAKLICANMAFNLGRSRLSKFVNFRAAVEAQDWQRAALEAADSRWHSQVPNRAGRLIKRLRGLADG